MKKLLTINVLVLTAIALPTVAASSGDIRDLADAYNRRDNLDLARQVVTQEPAKNVAEVGVAHIGSRRIELNKEDTLAVLKVLQDRNRSEISRLAEKIGISAEQLPYYENLRNQLPE